MDIVWEKIMRIILVLIFIAIFTYLMIKNATLIFQ